MSGENHGLPNSGTTSICLLITIRFASQVYSHFYFEDSMIEPIKSFSKDLVPGIYPIFKSIKGVGFRK
jgi:hypothetical protein